MALGARTFIGHTKSVVWLDIVFTRLTCQDMENLQSVMGNNRSVNMPDT
jgi:hypothetical protein